jgi:hypothetical protein
MDLGGALKWPREWPNRALGDRHAVCAVQVKESQGVLGAVVNIGISASEYSGQTVFLVTTSDVTVQLMAQRQLIQASATQHTPYARDPRIFRLRKVHTRRLQSMDHAAKFK